jgi:hypothetical protein
VTNFNVGALELGVFSIMAPNLRAFRVMFVRMAVVRVLETPERTPHNPPTYELVPWLTRCAASGESMAFNVSIVHINVAFSFRRIVGVAPVAVFTMQLLCRASDIEGVIAVEPTVDIIYLMFPPELI